MNSITTHLFSSLNQGNGAHIHPLERLSSDTKLLYAHLNNAAGSERKLKELVDDKIYMSQDYEKCIKHSVNHQKYTFGPYEDLYLHILDSSVARKNAEVDSAASRKIRLIEKCSSMHEGFNSYKGSLPIIETIAFRKGRNGNWSDEDSSIVRIRKNGDMKNAIYEKLSYSTREWITM